ncbi:MAG: hypothetical protein KUF79_17240 [Candidatus Thiodiazotropha sp. (ex Ctena orbiculata)]|nr:hypothetical protein [Candidatus Thiodiazotropha taylori]
MAINRNNDPKKGIIQFPSSSISAKIHREKIRLINTRQRTKTPEDTLLSFADRLQLDLIYLSDQERHENEPVIEDIIDIVARIHAWFDDY